MRMSISLPASRFKVQVYVTVTESVCSIGSKGGAHGHVCGDCGAPSRILIPVLIPVLMCVPMLMLVPMFM